MTKSKSDCGYTDSTRGTELSIQQVSIRQRRGDSTYSRHYIDCIVPPIVD